jgi:hypothetical protein
MPKTIHKWTTSGATLQKPYYTNKQTNKIEVLGKGKTRMKEKVEISFQ